MTFFSHRTKSNLTDSLSDIEEFDSYTQITKFLQGNQIELEAES